LTIVATLGIYGYFATANSQQQTSSSASISSTPVTSSSSGEATTVRSSTATQGNMTLVQFITDMQAFYANPSPCASGFKASTDPGDFSGSEILSMKVINSTQLSLAGANYSYDALLVGGQPGPGKSELGPYSISYSYQSDPGNSTSSVRFDLAVNGTFETEYTVTETPLNLQRLGAYALNTYFLGRMRIITMDYDPDCGPQIQRLWLVVVQDFGAPSPAWLAVAETNGAPYVLDYSQFGVSTSGSGNEIQSSDLTMHFEHDSNQTVDICGDRSQKELGYIDVSVPITSQGEYDLTGMTLSTTDEFFFGCPPT